MRASGMLMVCGLVVLACAREDERATRASGDTATVAPVDTPPLAPDLAQADTPARARDLAPARNDSTAVPILPELTAVRVALHPGFERVVFEFRGGLRTYRTEYIDRPVTQCGSGAVVPLPGDAWLAVRFAGANAHTEAGELSLTSTDILYNGPNIKRLKQICDFEGVVEWVIAVAYPGRFEQTELANPARLAVDIRAK